MKWLKLILSFPSVVYNWLILHYRNIDWVAYPSIKGIIIIGGWGKLSIGNNVVVNSSHRSNPVGAKNRTSIHIVSGALIQIGDKVGISNSLFYARKSITIEDEVLIGGGCQIYDNDFHAIQYEDRILRGDREVKSAPVLIKKGAFIGTSCIILKGVTIGERSVIAAGSVVVKDVPSDEIWGGNPAKFIRKL